MISVVYLLHPGLGLAVPGCEQWRISLFLGAYNFPGTDESPWTKAPPDKSPSELGQNPPRIN